MNKIYVSLLMSVFLFSIGMNVASVAGVIDAIVSTEINEIDILLLVDQNYGGEYNSIWPIFERWGWNVTVAGTAEILDPCPPQPETAILVPDILIYDIDDVTKFDTISIMPGSAHDILRTNQSCIDLIQAAVAEGLVVSAWCRAVRVLASADVLDGVNITGHADYESEYVAAGATFNLEAPPVIDENIITSCADRVNRNAMCEAIATALGVFEQTPPEISSVVFSEVETQVGSSVNVTCIFTDDSGIHYARAEFFRIDESDIRDPVHSLEIVLDKQSEFRFTGDITDLEDGNYTLDIYVKDLFLNTVTHTDAAEVSIPLPLIEGTTTGALLGIDPLILGAISVSAVFVVAVIIVVSKRN